MFSLRHDDDASMIALRDMLRFLYYDIYYCVCTMEHSHCSEKIVAEIAALSKLWVTETQRYL